MFINLVVIALNFVAPVAAPRDQAACLKRIVRLTRLWCRDAGESRVAGGHQALPWKRRSKNKA